MGAEPVKEDDMTPQKSLKETMNETRMTLLGSELRDHIQTALCLSDYDSIPAEQKKSLENLIVSSAFVSHQRSLRESPQTAQQAPGHVDQGLEPKPKTYIEAELDRGLNPPPAHRRPGW
jgi:hypothetical protein